MMDCAVDFALILTKLDSGRTFTFGPFASQFEAIDWYNVAVLDGHLSDPCIIALWPGGPEADILEAQDLIVDAMMEDPQNSDYFLEVAVWLGRNPDVLG